MRRRVSYLAEKIDREHRRNEYMKRKLEAAKERKAKEEGRNKEN